MATNAQRSDSGKATKPTFRGFETPDANFFRMPTCWTDITAAINNLAELKVVEFILRHTWGYQEYGLKKHITVDEFVRGRRRKDGSRIDRGTGLSERGVRYGLDKAVEDGLIEEEIDDRDPGRVKKYYCLRMREEPQSQAADEATHSGVQTLHPGVQTLPPRGADFAPRSEKDTPERNLNHSNGDDREGAEEGEDVSGPPPQAYAPIQDKLAGRENRTPTRIGEILSRSPVFRRPAKVLEVERQAIQQYVAELGAEMGDEAKLAVSSSRVLNLYRKSGLELGQFIGVLMECRSRTREYAAKIRKRRGDDLGGGKNRFPYFLAVVEDRLRLRSANSSE